ncbi:molybdopterin-dependent oxidoreductase [Neomoorella thermoacetica]|uniref:Formate dehydrogenase n=1 Tax=Moorella thermoacetica (strain ATCC 39073 / JCM 9320) TaxID=264732 RepID=Q2RLA8_MOOTA|nr:molybdopterin-dependent oxidoreductase [Moorella thermoacetica]AKX93199.1 polysulfide reductase chain A precursor [Moorella thermoacetica]AKX95841.1 polysulfide reductase chain A precursor [Moorella thermoacetica]OIQ53832.1 polysulfide reductase chain A precursor [Moorella thermoacetica]OIQ55928.1 polysulfide reductase chain A precursor [Moorella thermoacetica]QCZ99655.1 Polysulfide reductase chain A precursor [Moorella thermoacetica]
MLEQKITRRTFLKGSLAAGALATFGGKLIPIEPAKAAAAGQAETRVVPTLCEMCGVKCGVLAHVRDGRVWRLTGNPRDPQSGGRLCARGNAGTKTLYDPDRLKGPMKRVGEGQFQPISWEQAFQEIGSKLKELKEQYGPQSLVWLAHPELISPLEKHFMAAFGSPNYTGHGPTCYSSRNVAFEQMYGGVPGVDYRNVRYYIAFGRNLTGGIKNPDVQKIVAAKAEGAHLVAVDPRLSDFAYFADEWLPIRPGTDLAMVLAMINVLINENLYDAAFVAAYTTGFEELKKGVSGYTPAWAAGITGIEAGTISRIARELAAAKPAAAVDPGWHAVTGSQYGNSVQAGRAIAALNALLGNLGARGGLSLPPTIKLGSPAGIMGPKPPAATAPRWDGAGSEKWPLNKDHGMIQTFPERVKQDQPYPVKAVIIQHLNPVRSSTDSLAFIEALKKLDLVVAIDIQMNDTAYYAHYILPEATYLERYDPLMTVGNKVLLRQPAIKPLFDNKGAEEIIAGIGRAAGLSEYFNFTLEQYNDALLGPLGLTQAQLALTGVAEVEASKPDYSKLKTPSGKIELACPAFVKAGSTLTPAWEPPLVEPRDDSFRLIQGHVPMHTHTTTDNNSYLHAIMPENELWIHTSRAGKLGIKTGDLVEVASKVGKVRVKARVTEAIHPEAVFLAHGFGCRVPLRHLAYNRGANGGDLIPIMTAPVSGAAAQCETLVTVRKAG